MKLCIGCSVKPEIRLGDALYSLPGEPLQTPRRAVQVGTRGAYPARRPDFSSTVFPGCTLAFLLYEVFRLS